ncbi:MAG: hypothetical protein NDJ89_15535 [Oligoflexia bacterium]|nr:hypothetical protein [Oligoflexia bacterium]
MARMGGRGCAIAAQGASSLLSILLIASGCAKKAETATGFTVSTRSYQFSAVSGSNHDATVAIGQTTYSGAGAIKGFAQALPESAEISFTIPMLEDLGEFGSLTLVGKATSIPSPLSYVTPFLVSLSDGTNELVNLARTGASGDCRAAGLLNSSGTDQNPGCVVNSPSAFAGFMPWFLQQYGVMSSAPSVNLFPTCNWTGGVAPPSTDPSCAFNSNFFVGGKLRSGVNYTAKYVLITEEASSVTGLSAGMELTVLKKSDATSGGAVDLNLVIVGNSNISASRSEKGTRNLNTLLGSVSELLNQAGTGIRIGSVSLYEWGGTDGDAYATIRSDQLSTLFRAGETFLSSASGGKAMNVYLIQQFSDDSQFLGMSGAILGPPMNGLSTSGVAVATFGEISSYNPDCTSGETCALATQDAGFVDWGATIAHEMGHYLGLNHPSERDGTMHDTVLDTPICTAKGTSGYIGITSCRATDTHVISGSTTTCNDACPGYSATTGVFCPTRPECQFNHLMWWSSKNFSETTLSGDGNLISTYSGLKLNYNPLIQ